MSKTLGRAFPVLERMNQNRAKILEWLARHEAQKELPIYSSVDIRDAGWKLAVVDTNLFPSGFNNLCEHGIQDSVDAVRAAVQSRIAGCRNVLVIAEEHTRNLWYLENLRILQQIIEQAGFNVKVATFLDVKPAVCQDVRSVELETATGHPLRIFSIGRVLKDITAGGMYPCLVILNNDLTTGIPDVLKDAKTPIYPSMQAGWHSRLKSHHFKHTADLMREFADIMSVDPWLFSCQDAVVEDVDIREDRDCARVADVAADLMRRVREKYAEHGIQDKPFVFLKADYGTYGMGVTAFEDAEEIRRLSRRRRHKLYKGKGARVISRYLLQEGVPTVHQIGDRVSEVCIYQIDNRLVGGFYRTHDEKSDRENLNARGMTFQKICPHADRYQQCGAQTDANMFDVYRILARIAGIAAHREIVQLETVSLPVVTEGRDASRSTLHEGRSI